MKLDVTVRDPLLQKYFSALDVGGRRLLNEHMAISVKDLTQRHLVKLKAERKNKFGAPSSDYFKQAAESVERAAISADALSASFSVNQPGLARAFRDVTITPKKAKALTIPVAAIAYNRRAGSFSDIFVFKEKGGNAFLAQRDPTGGAIKLLYILLRKVTQKQDRSILPSDKEWEQAAKDGAVNFIRSLGK